MSGNFVMSSDEEKRINDILESGINQIKGKRIFSMNNMERERKKEQNLKSSNISMENSIFNVQNTNFTIEKREGLYSNNNYANKLNLNNDVFYKNFEDIYTNNQFTDFSNDDNSIFKINNRHNINSTGNLTSSNKSNISTTNVKSSALRNLLDEMKQNNKYLSSSEDEGGYSQKFNKNFTNDIKLDSDLTNEEDNQYKNLRKINVLETFPDIENELKCLKEIKCDKNKENEKLEPIMKSELDISDNSILLKESVLRFNTPDLMKTNTLTTENSIRNETNNLLVNDKERSSKNLNKLLRSNESRTEDPNFSNLTDMHSEIKILQNKLEGIEKKLQNSVNSNSYISSAATISNNRSKAMSKKLPNKSFDKDIKIPGSKKYKNYVSDDEVCYNNSKNKLNSNLLLFNSKPLTNSKNKSCNKDGFLKRSYSSKSDKSSHLSKSKYITGQFKSKLDYKEKFENIKENYDSVKATLIKERQIINQLTNKNKKLMKKEENYDKLYKSHQELKAEYILLSKKYEESEYIRKEQSKLMKSMQREINLLRGQFQDSLENNTEKIIKEHKEIKNRLSKHDSRDNQRDHVKNMKIKKKSISKTKATKIIPLSKNVAF